MISAILTVCRKEILDNSRDRRTLLFSILFGPILLPVLFLFLLNLQISQNISSVVETIDVPIIGAEDAPNLVRFLEGRGIAASAGHDLTSIDEAISAVRNGDQHVVVFMAESFGQELTSGTGAHVSLVFDGSNNTADRTLQRIQQEIDAYSRQIGALRLLARGVDPADVIPLIVDNLDVSTADPRSRFLFPVTMILLMSILLGGYYLASDTTAGERERKSLEPLLATPVPRSSLVLGKIGATVAYMFLSLALTLTLLTVSLRFAAFDEIGMSSLLDPGTALTLLLVLTPFVLLGAPLMTLVASYSKSVKEAQGYLGAVIIVPPIPLIFASIYNWEPSLALMTVPSLSQHLLITDLIRAEPIDASMLTVSVISTLLLAAVLTYAAVRLYEREQILG